MTVTIGIQTLLAPLLLMLFGLVLAVLADSYISRDNRRIMLIIAALCLSLIVQNLWEYELVIGRPRPILRTVLSVFGYSARPVILILFLYITQPNGRKWPQWALAGINAALYCTSPFTKLCFYIREADNISIRGPLWLTCFLVSAILLVELFVQTVFRYRETRKWEHLIPLSISLLIITSVILDFSTQQSEQSISLLTVAVTVGSVFYYIWLHLQFVRAHEKDLIAGQQIKIMMSQIQPHFLFNTIATFKALCGRDPDKAAEVAEKFGQYLRQNLDSLDTDGLIPFEKELEHTRLYADIEMTRFENVRVEYDIQDCDFLVPPLTVQPIVENAIRHGVRIRKEGRVAIRSRLTDAAHEIVIRDNGAGFDVKQLENADSSHIGIRNVRERLEKLCGGSLTLESLMGEGTTAIIRVPRGEKAK